MSCITLHDKFRDKIIVNFNFLIEDKRNTKKNLFYGVAVLILNQTKPNKISIKRIK
jgi:hypothetical protein